MTSVRIICRKEHSMLTPELHMERAFVPTTTVLLFIMMVCKPGGLKILDFPESGS